MCAMTNCLLIQRRILGKENLKLEKEAKDQFELLLSIKTEKITAVDNETGNVLFTAPEGMFNVQFKSDDEVPIVSFTGIPLGGMILIDADEHHAEFLFPFTEKEYDTMREIWRVLCYHRSQRT